MESTIPEASNNCGLYLLMAIVDIHLSWFNLLASTVYVKIELSNVVLLLFCFKSNKKHSHIFVTKYFLLHCLC